MKSIWAFCFFFVFLLTSCGNDNAGTNTNKSDSDMDAVRNFLDAALKGDYRNASAYMLQDSTNLGYLTVTERSYQRLSVDERRNLRTSSLNFYDTKQVNDSTTITIFANSYRNDKDTLRVVRRGGHWLVDLKYLFEHDMDTSDYKQRARIDTIHK